MHFRSKRVAIASSLLIAFFVLLLLRQEITFTGTDYFAWGADATELAACTSTQACKLSKFPPAYLLNSAWVNSYLNTEDGPATALLAINLLLCTLAMTALRSLSVWRDTARLLIFVAALMATPLPSFYAYSGALELQSGIILSLWGLLLTHKEKAHKIPLVISSICACLYKDTNPLLLVIFIVLVAVENSAASRKRNSAISAMAIQKDVLWSKMKASLAGIALGQLAMTCYNYIRYGDIFPRDYIHEALHRSPDAGMKLVNLTGLVFSPNGGLVSFWGVACLFLLAIFRCEYRVFYGSTMIFVGATFIGLSGWWAPCLAIMYKALI